MEPKKLLKLAHQIANNSAFSTYVDHDDLTSVAYLAALELLNKSESDETKGKESAWLGQRMRGAIIDAARSNGFLCLIHIPRSARERGIDLKATSIDTKECEGSLNAASLRMSYDPPIDRIQAAEERGFLYKAINGLTAQEYLVTQYVLNDYNQPQIAELLDITASRVSQIQKAALKKLALYITKKPLKE